MTDQKFKKFECMKSNKHYAIEEDFVGFYLISYNDQNKNESSEDHLLDSLESAMLEAEEMFGIPKNRWKEIKDE